MDNIKTENVTWRWKGRGSGGQVVNLIALYSIDPSSNPTGTYIFL